MRILNYILPIALVGGVAFWAYRKLKNANGVHRDDINTVIEYPVYKPKLTKEQVKYYARELFNAMDRVGTDTDMMRGVYDVISLKTGAFRQVYNEFGLKRYFLVDSTLLLGRNLDLIGWIKEELSGKDLTKWLDLAKKEGVI